MARISIKLPENWRLLLLRITILLLCMQLTRVLFYLFNSTSFQHTGFMDFFSSIWLDLVTVSLLGFPFIVLSVIPLGFTSRPFYQKFLAFLFHVLNLLFIALNLIDVEYFRYTQKRSTVDLFTIISAGEDFMQQLSSFFRDFWLLLVFLVVIFGISLWLHKKIKRHSGNRKLLKETLFFVVGLACFVLIARGGFRLKPISPLDASRFTRVENTALILNTPFTLIKSMSQGGIEEKHYFDLQTELSLFNPIQETKAANLLPEKTNVVLIILESFGSEWVGAAGAKKSFTPFLDSLSKHSLFFKNGIANGKKSIEAIPCIVSSIPSLTDNPYISSPYGNNRIESMASVLAKNGYETGFFHGATNGSMRFDGFAAQTGFQHYFGRKEYNNDAHFDESWGILDEYFNPWTAKELTKFKKPFFASLFTLSSHHPYYIPKHMRGKLRTGPMPICQSIHYGDYSLQRFFEQAKKEPWYKNTIFVICADHTSATASNLYAQRTEMYKIPILFFDPQGRIKPKTETRIFQQMDIMPTILELLNVNTKIYSYGHSYYENAAPEAINYIEGTYCYYKNGHMLTFSNEKARNLYGVLVRTEDTPDSLSYYRKEAKAYERRLKAIIQRYHRDLILNQTKVE